MAELGVRRAEVRECVIATGAPAGRRGPTTEPEGHGRVEASSAGTSLRIGLAAARNAPSVEERLQTARPLPARRPPPGRSPSSASRRPTSPACAARTSPCRPPTSAARRPRSRRSAPPRSGTAWPSSSGMEWETAAGLHNVAFVVSRDGTVQGYQAKNQIPLEEAPYYVPDGRRRLFEVDGVPFGITICHEGWRYPETVRWAAVRGAQARLPPAADRQRPQPARRSTRWGDPDSPYYEKAMIARGVENTVYFASVNYALRYQDSATSLIGPDGDLPGPRPLRPGAAARLRPRPLAGHRALRPALQPGPLPAGLGPRGWVWSSSAALMPPKKHQARGPSEPARPPRAGRPRGDRLTSARAPLPPTPHPR